VTQPEPSGTKHPGWRDASVVVAAIGLFLTLAFNTFTVWRSERETRKARIANEVSLLTQVGESSNRASQDLVASGANDDRCKKAVAFSLNDRDEARLVAALTYYDYLAWLFNKGQVKLASAKEYWGPQMIDVYRLGRIFEGDQVDALYRELSFFVGSAPKALRPADPCR